jgi:hypothetical protein
VCDNLLLASVALADILLLVMVGVRRDRLVGAVPNKTHPLIILDVFCSDLSEAHGYFSNYRITFRTASPIELILPIAQRLHGEPVVSARYMKRLRMKGMYSKPTSGF